MRYHGGKTRYGRNIAQIISDIVKVSKVTIEGYIEPFCGMCGVFVHVVKNTDLKTYIASDINASVVCMWENLREGWRPDIQNFNEDRFNQIKADGHSNAEKGFFGHAMTFGGLYFQSYRPELRKLLPYSSADVVKRIEVMKNVNFLHNDYREIFKMDLSNYIIYCDPPYERRSRYYDEKNKIMSFDSDELWKQCVSISERNIVVLSEQGEFFRTRLCQYKGNKKVLKLPGRENTFGATTKNSDEHVCVMTFLDVFKNYMKQE